MKRLFTVLLLAACASGHELPLFGPVPKLGEEWRVREREVAERPEMRYSWLVLTNSRTGDFLSFFEEKLNGKPFSKANRVPWSDMAGDRFPGGHSTWHKPEGYQPVVHWIRNDVVDVSIVNTNRNTNYIEQALEYTLVFEDRSGPERMAHGYVLPMGEFRILAQHTSTNVITADFAHSMISQMLWDYVNQKRAVEVEPAASSEATADTRKSPIVLDIKVTGKVSGVYWSVQSEFCVIQINFPSVPVGEKQPKHAETQVWLLKGDGSVITPNKRAEVPWIGKSGYETASFIYTFPKSAAREAVGAVVSVDGQLFVETLKPQVK